MNKRMPTFVGLLILVGALISGVVFLGDGPGVFAPRATSETEPSKYRVTNVTATSLTISFYTVEKTSGFIKYGTDPKKLNSQASDDRDQLSGNVGKYQLHHITVRGLQPNTTYYYVLGTGSRAEFDNDGEPFNTKTGSKLTQSPPEARTVYGSVSTAGGTPAEGSIVYLTADGVGEMSSMVKSSGSWAIPLSKARSKDGARYAKIGAQDQINLLIQGKLLPNTISYQTTVSAAQPVEELSFGETYEKTAASESAQVASDSADQKDQPRDASSSANSDSPDNEKNKEETATDSAEGAELAKSDEEDEEVASISGRLQELLAEAEAIAQDSTASAVLTLASDAVATESTEPTVTNDSPKIVGTAKPNVEVKVSIHSDNNVQSTVMADATGQFTLDLEALKQTLEPGEHTVTYSYIDPDTGEEVEKTEVFWVEDPNAVQLAQADGDDSSGDSTSPTEAPAPTDSEIPYGSGDPYPMTSVIPTATTSTSTPSPTLSSRKEVVATDSTLDKAGSIGNTLALVLSGLFFIFSGVWSWWLASELED